MHWPTATMVKMGVTYDDLLELGLTPDTMTLLNYTLMMWATMGFRRQHAEVIPPNTLYRLFGLTKQEVLACLRGT
jgi:hypothetical protein